MGKEFINNLEASCIKEFVDDYIKWCDQKDRKPFFGEMFSTTFVRLAIDERTKETFDRSKGSEVYNYMEENYDV